MQKYRFRVVFEFDLHYLCKQIIIENSLWRILDMQGYQAESSILICSSRHWGIRDARLSSKRRCRASGNAQSLKSAFPFLGKVIRSWSINSTDWGGRSKTCWRFSIRFTIRHRPHINQRRHWRQFQHRQTHDDLDGSIGGVWAIGDCRKMFSWAKGSSTKGKEVWQTERIAYNEGWRLRCTLQVGRKHRGHTNQSCHQIEVNGLSLAPIKGHWTKQNKITVSNIPDKAYEYIVNDKSAVEWIVERYCVSTDKKSLIKNDCNDWALEHHRPRYILDLLLSVINVSVNTVDIVNSLPKLKLA